jgi:hypothetical protein
MLVSLGASGCFVAEDDPGTDAAADAAETTGSGPGSASGTSSRPASTKTGNGTAVGSAPVLGDVSVNATGLSALFTILASDADNDTLTFTIAFGDNATANGTLAPATGANATAGTLLGNVTHDYAEAGTYNATIAVSDGKSAVNQTVAVVVASAVAGTQAPLTISGEVQCLPTIVVNGHRGGGAHEFEVLAGQATMVLTLTYTDGDFNDLDYTVTSPGGDATVSDEGGPEPPVTVDGPEAGVWKLAVKGYSCVSSLKYTMDITFA